MAKNGPKIGKIDKKKPKLASKPSLVASNLVQTDSNLLQKQHGAITAPSGPQPDPPPQKSGGLQQVLAKMGKKRGKNIVSQKTPLVSAKKTTA